jgi:hypothetical protein
MNSDGSFKLISDEIKKIQAANGFDALVDHLKSESTAGVGALSYHSPVSASLLYLLDIDRAELAAKEVYVENQEVLETYASLRGEGSENFRTDEEAYKRLIDHDQLELWLEAFQAKDPFYSVAGLYLFRLLADQDTRERAINRCVNTLETQMGSAMSAVLKRVECEEDLQFLSEDVEEEEESEEGAEDDEDVVVVEVAEENLQVLTDLKERLQRKSDKPKNRASIAAIDDVLRYHQHTE